MSMRVTFFRRVPILLVTLFCKGVWAQDAPKVEPLELRHGEPFVQVMVNGKGPFTFGIDTGTGGDALVCPTLAEKLGLPVTGEAEAGDPSGKNSRKVPVYLISSLKVAGVEFKDIKAEQFPLAPRPGEGDCYGTLGFLLFRDYLFSLDIPNQQLILSSGSLSAGDGTIPFTLLGDVPLISLKVGSRRIEAHIDSGGKGLSLPEAFAKDLEFASPPIVLGRGRTASNEFEIKGAQLAGDIQVAGYTFAQPFVEINPVFSVANFGSIPLKHFAVTFDQKNKLVRFVSHERTLTINPPRMMAMPVSQPDAQPVPQSEP